MQVHEHGAAIGMEATLTKLSTAERNAMPDRMFGLPETRGYPMPDQSHARNAKARAAEEFDRGNLSRNERDQIDRKADDILSEEE
jgi:hypothetical protein